MSFENERNFIETRFKTEWANGSNLAVDYENTPFDTPVATSWVRLNILNGSSEYRSMGCKKNHLGVIIVQIFTPSGTGAGQARDYADEVATIFDSQTFDGVVCNVASIKSIGIDGAFYQMNVSIPFWRNE